MKRPAKIPITSFIFISALLMLLNSCKKDAENNNIDNPPPPTPGNGIIFNPNLTYGSISDVDGNTYKTIVIGSQTWMAENLRTTKYSNGDSIPLVSDSVAWINLSTPAYCWYKNNQTNYGNTYGALYNKYTVNTTHLCPTGWHVPTDNEWTILANYLGGYYVAGGKVKETDTIHWKTPNAGATNESGFTALPGGRRKDTGAFNAMRFDGYWWSSTWVSDYQGFHWFIYNNGNFIDKNYEDIISGNSVRCIKN